MLFETAEVSEGLLAELADLHQRLTLNRLREALDPHE
jgi:hypothetical protein